MGLFGSGMEDAAKSAAKAQVAAGNKAIGTQREFLDKSVGALEKYYGIGVGNIEDYFIRSQNQSAPYQFLGYNAADLLSGTVGVPTPQGGSFSLAQALDLFEQEKKANLAQQKAGSPALNAAGAKLSSLAAQFNSVFPTWQGTRGGRLQGIEDTYDFLKNNVLYQGPGIAATGRDSRNESINLRGGNRQAKLKAMLPQIQAAVAEYDRIKALPPPTPISMLTPEQRGTVEQYRAGTLKGEVSPTSSALSKFFATPEYALQFGTTGAAVDPNASVRDRFQSSPGYEFQFDEGRRALEKSASARGLLESGSFARELDKFGQGIANQEFNNYLNRVTGTFQGYQDQLAQLAGFGSSYTNPPLTAGTGVNLSNLAMGTGANIAGAYTGAGTNISDILMAQGAAQTGGITNAANARQQRSSGLSGLGSAIGSQFGGPLGGLAGGILGGLF